MSIRPPAAVARTAFVTRLARTRSIWLRIREHVRQLRWHADAEGQAGDHEPGGAMAPSLAWSRSATLTTSSCGAPRPDSSRERSSSSRTSVSSRSASSRHT